MLQRWRDVNTHAPLPGTERKVACRRGETRMEGSEQAEPSEHNNPSSGWTLMFTHYQQSFDGGGGRGTEGTGRERRCLFCGFLTCFLSVQEDTTILGVLTTPQPPFHYSHASDSYRETRVVSSFPFRFVAVTDRSTECEALSRPQAWYPEQPPAFWDPQGPSESADLLLVLQSPGHIQTKRRSVWIHFNASEAQSIREAATMFSASVLPSSPSQLLSRQNHKHLGLASAHCAAASPPKAKCSPGEDSWSVEGGGGPSGGQPSLPQHHACE